MLRGLEKRKREEVGAMALIVPGMRRKSVMDFYDANILKLKEYDDRHKTDMVETLIAYTKSEWDISLTATRMYQHDNTIRYRLKKIRQILNIDSGPDGQMQLTVLASLHKLRKMLGGNSIV